MASIHNFLILFKEIIGFSVHIPWRDRCSMAIAKVVAVAKKPCSTTTSIQSNIVSIQPIGTAKISVYVSLFKSQQSQHIRVGFPSACSCWSVAIRRVPLSTSEPSQHTFQSSNPIGQGLYTTIMCISVKLIYPTNQIRALKSNLVL